MVEDIDKTSFLILYALQSADRALWKKKIHEQFPDKFDHNVSLQTIGRRVETLVESGLIESVITSPDEIKRDLIIGYSITKDGKQALHAKRRKVLENIVQENMFSDKKQADIGKEALVEMVCNHFECPDNVRVRLRDECSEHELITALTSQLVEQETADMSDLLQTSSHNVSAPVSEGAPLRSD